MTNGRILGWPASWKERERNIWAEILLLVLLIESPSLIANWLNPTTIKIVDKSEKKSSTHNKQAVASYCIISQQFNQIAKCVTHFILHIRRHTKKEKKEAVKYNKHCSNQIINKLNNHLDHATWIPTLNKKISKIMFLLIFYIQNFQFPLIFS